MSKRQSKVTIDHDEIREWAEARDAKPSIVRGTGIIRLDFPGFTGEDKLKHVSWDEWFDAFEESNLALVFEETTARGVTSNFNKLVGRETIDLKTGELTGPPRRRAKQAAAGRRGTKSRNATARAGRGKTPRAASGTRSRTTTGTTRSRGTTGSRSRSTTGTTGTRSRGASTTGTTTSTTSTTSSSRGRTSRGSRGRSTSATRSGTRSRGAKRTGTSGRRRAST